MSLVIVKWYQLGELNPSTTAPLTPKIAVVVGKPALTNSSLNTCSGVSLTLGQRSHSYHQNMLVSDYLLYYPLVHTPIV